MAKPVFNNGLIYTNYSTTSFQFLNLFLKQCVKPPCPMQIKDILYDRQMVCLRYTFYFLCYFVFSIFSHTRVCDMWWLLLPTVSILWSLESRGEWASRHAYRAVSCLGLLRWETCLLGWYHFLCRNPQRYKKWESDPDISIHCSLSMDEIWPALLSTCCLNFLAMMNCTLNCKPKWVFQLSLPTDYFISNCNYDTFVFLTF